MNISRWVQLYNQMPMSDERIVNIIGLLGFLVLTILGLAFMCLPIKQGSLKDYFLSLLHRGKYKRRWLSAWINLVSLISGIVVITIAFVDSNDFVRAIRGTNAKVEYLKRSADKFNNKQPTYIVNGRSNKIISVSTDDEPERFILIKPKKITDSYVRGGWLLPNKPMKS